MDIKDVKRKERIKKVRINLRTDKEAAEWMQNNDVSPQLIFDNAINELMDRE